MTEPQQQQAIHRRARRHPARRTRRGLAIGAGAATVLLAGTLWAADELATAPTASPDTSTSSGSGSSLDPSVSSSPSSESSSSSPTISPSVAAPDTTSHAS